ncbi:MAG: hypothetical protein B6D59_04490 [Campylobacteraceae bacterium 4484_4]|nr:MAG: hypothetical protein B6D59_04490 [Campylobacteraceae bacterium 4484_4]
MREGHVFVDSGRYEVNEMYWEVMEHPEAIEGVAKVEALRKIIGKDPDFFDPYIALYEHYLSIGDTESAADILNEGFTRAMALVSKEGKFPDFMPWEALGNRHIIRMIYNFSTLLWLVGRKGEAKELLQKLLKADPEDHIGARFAIAAIDEGYESLYAFEMEFTNREAGVDPEAMEGWYRRRGERYQASVCNQAERRL